MMIVINFSSLKLSVDYYLWNFIDGFDACKKFIISNEQLDRLMTI